MSHYVEHVCTECAASDLLPLVRISNYTCGYCIKAQEVAAFLDSLRPTKAETYGQASLEPWQLVLLSRWLRIEAAACRP